MKLIRILLVFIVLGVCAFAALPYLCSHPSTRPYVLGLINDKEQTLSVETLTLSWFGEQKATAVQYRNLKEEMQVAINEVQWEQSLWNLLWNRSDLGVLTVDSPVVQYVVADGKAEGSIGKASSGDTVPSYYGKVLVQNGELHATYGTHVIYVNQVQGRFERPKNTRRMQFNLQANIQDNGKEGLIKTYGHLDGTLNASNVFLEVKTLPLVLVHSWLPQKIQPNFLEAAGNTLDFKGNLTTIENLPIIHLEGSTETLLLKADLVRSDKVWRLKSPFSCQWEISETLFQTLSPELDVSEPVGIRIEVPYLEYHAEKDLFPRFSGGFSTSTKMRFHEFEIPAFEGEFRSDSLGKLLVKPEPQFIIGKHALQPQLRGYFYAFDPSQIEFEIEDPKFPIDSFFEGFDFLGALLNVKVQGFIRDGRWIVDFAATSDNTSFDGALSLAHAQDWFFQRPINFSLKLSPEQFRSHFSKKFLPLSPIQLTGKLLALEDRKLQGDLHLEGLEFPTYAFSNIEGKVTLSEDRKTLLAGLHGSSLVKPSLQGGEFLLNVSGELFDLLSELEVELKAEHFPMEFFDTFFSIPLQTALGPAAECSLKASIHEKKGPFSLQLSSPEGFLRGDFMKHEKYISLETPLQAEFQSIHPDLAFDEPVKIMAPNRSSYFPIEPRKRLLSHLERMTVYLGKGKAYERGIIEAITKFLNISDSAGRGQTSVWFTPLYLHIAKGVLALERADVLLGNRLPVAVWGTVDLIDEELNLRIALPAETLRLSFGIEHLGPDSDFMLVLPIKGTLSNPKFDAALALSRITALKFQQGGDDILGTLFQVITSPKDQFQDIPPPTTYPFPWEREINRNRFFSP